MTSATAGRSQRRFVDVAGTRIRVFVHDARRNDGGAAVVLVHGAGGNYLQWPPRLRRMPGLLTVAPDLPGHGDSGGDGLDAASAYATFMQELVDSLRLSGVIVIGHSMGAAVALEYARLADSSVAGIGVLAGGERLPIPDELFGLIRSDFEAAVHCIAQASFGPDATDDMRSLYLERLRSTDPGVLHADFAACREFDARAFASGLEIPALILAGSDDRMVPLSSSRSLHERLPASELHVLDDAGHLFLWERTEVVRDQIEGLVARATNR